MLHDVGPTCWLRLSMPLNLEFNGMHCSISRVIQGLYKHDSYTQNSTRVCTSVKPVTDEQFFYDKFLCDKFYLLVCTRNFDNFFYDKRTCSKVACSF